MIPQFIIIGAMKSGTSSLYHYLGSHPEIGPSAPKETDFFVAEKNRQAKTVRNYERYFPKDTKYVFEASTNYSKRHLFPGVPERIHELVPEAKLIYVVRDPIERAVSNYVHNVAAGRENRGLSSAVRRENSSYLLTGCYFYQLQAFLRCFDEKQILLVESEKLRKQTASAVEAVFDFLEIPPRYDPSLLKKKHHQSSNKMRLSRIDRAVHRHVRNPLLRAAIKRVVPRRLRAPVSFERPHLTDADRTFLKEKLSPDVEKLRSFSGMSFSNWSL